MQNDLISKKEVINLLCNLHIDNISVNDKRVTEYIREMPCAYDMKKVVEDLKRIDFALVNKPSDYEELLLRVFKKNAIDIVMKGGTSKFSEELLNKVWNEILNGGKE